MKRKVLSLLLTLALCLSLVPLTAVLVHAAGSVETPAASDNAVRIYGDRGSGFELLSELYFEDSVTEQSIMIDQPITALRIVKGVCYELNLDQLTLEGVCPAGYERKLSATDNDLIEIEDSEDFALCGSGELIIAGRAPVEVKGETYSFKYPSSNLGAILPGSEFYSYVPGSNPGSFSDGDTLIVPDQKDLFASEMCYPDSGHPDAPMDIYVTDDGETLYVFFEAFLDNTFDHGKDFAGVHVKCGDIVKTYKVHTTDTNEYGRWWYDYTDSSEIYDWEHMCYLVMIPLADLDTENGALSLAFEYYGTAYAASNLIIVCIGDTSVGDHDSDYTGYGTQPKNADYDLPKTAGGIVNSAGGNTASGDWWLTNTGTEDAPDYILTLNGVDITSSVDTNVVSEGQTSCFSVYGNLTIELAEGSVNNFGIAGTGGTYYAMKFYGQEHTFCGAGTLNAKANNLAISAGSRLFIRDNATVNVSLDASFEGSSYTWGTTTFRAIDGSGIIVDNASLKATANVTVASGVTNKTSVYAIYAYSDGLTVQHDAVVEAYASGGANGGIDSAIYMSGELALNGTDVTQMEGDTSGSATVVGELTSVAESSYYFGSKSYVKLDVKGIAYPLYIAGTQVTELNEDDVLGDGKVCFDPLTYTLSLDGVTLTNESTGSRDKDYNGIHYTGFDPLEITVSGTNAITSRERTDGASIGIYCVKAPLTISGSGKLSVTAADIIGAGGWSTSSIGIYCGSTGITVDGPDVNVISGTGSSIYDSSGIYGDVKVSKGNLTIQTGDADEYCRGIYGRLTVDGGTVSITTGTSSEDNYCVASRVTVNDGKVTLTAGAGTYCSYGIYDGLYVNGGEIEILSGTSNNRSEAVAYNTYVYGGIAKLTSGEASESYPSYYSPYLYGGYVKMISLGSNTAQISTSSINVYDDDMVVIVSPNADGSNPVDFDKYNYSQYKYLEAGEIHDVSVTAGAGMTRVETSGEEDQTDVFGPMTPIIYTADADYSFPDDYASLGKVEGIVVTRDSETQITVSGLPTDDVELKLADAAASTYTLSYDANGGSGTMDSETYTSGAAITLKACGFTAPSGKQFRIWEIDGTEYEVGDGPVATADMTAKALWEDSAAPAPSGGGGGGATTYPVTPAEAENGKITVSPKNAAEGDKVTITVTPDEGYELDKLTVKDKDGNEIKVTENEDGTLTITMPASEIEVEATFKEAEETPGEDGFPFVDVPEDAYFRKAVEWALEEGVTGGTTPTTFSPMADATRAQTVTFLWAAAGAPEPETTENPFKDISESDYFYKAVLWAYENGITAGVSEDEFGPYQTVTRGQVVTFLYGYAGRPEAGTDDPFKDVSESDYFYAPVLWAYDEDITAGTSATMFSPDDDCLRGQIITFMYLYFAE